MYLANVMYPNSEGVKFDFDYFRTTHLKMVKESFEPHGLIKLHVQRGISGGSDLPAPYICIVNLYFESVDGYDEALSRFGKKLGADIPNFTNVKPIRQISEIIV
jgi:uncharacterized protein (TIGR02118 family)